MAPPKRYTNSSISMTGSISEVRMASTLRRLSRRLRPIITVPCRQVSSDIRGLLTGGATPGQGHEHVVEGGGAHGERADAYAVRVDVVEQRAHPGGAAVGGDLDGAPGRVGAQGVAVEGAYHLVVGLRVDQGEVQALLGHAGLELGGGAVGDDATAV